MFVAGAVVYSQLGLCTPVIFCKSTMDIVREAIANTEVFSVSPNFDLWHELRSAELYDFIANVDLYIVNSCWSAGSPAKLITSDIARPTVKPVLDTVLLAVRPVVLPVQSAETINRENLWERMSLKSLLPSVRSRRRTSFERMLQLSRMTVVG